MSHYTTEQLRTVALVGHGAAGKTTLAEALLARTGGVAAPGSVERGTTVSDFDPLEKAWKHSLRSSILHLDTPAARMHLIDTPGFPDFIGQSIGALDAVETAAIVVNAQSGIEMITTRMMEWAAHRKLCRIVIVNKIDAENVDLTRHLAAIQQTLGKECLPINLPAGNGTRVVDCFFTPAGEADFSSVAEAHQALVDQVVEVDEALMAKYLEQGEEIAPEQLHAPFEKALREGHLVPVCFVSARTGAGVAELLDVLVKLAPNPTEGNPPLFFKGEVGDTAEEFRSRAGPRAHVLAHVFKVVIDPFVGKLGIFRVHQGTVTKDTQLFVGDSRKPFKVGHLFMLQGSKNVEIDRAIPGDIAAVAKVDEVEFDVVLHDSHDEDQIHMRPLEFPHPMHGVAIIAEEAGRRAAHLRRAPQDRRRRPHAGRRAGPAQQRDRAARAGRPAPALGAGADGVAVQGRDRHAAAAHPLPRDDRRAGGGHLPAQEADRGRGPVRRGGAAGRAASARRGLRLRRRDQGRRDPAQPDAGGTQGRRAGARARRGRRVPAAGRSRHRLRRQAPPGGLEGNRVRHRGPQGVPRGHREGAADVLEPIVSVEIVCPEANTGDIAGDLSTRRGQVTGTKAAGPGALAITGVAPLVELDGYAARLKSVTGGHGAFTMALSHYEAAPATLQQQLVAEFEKKRKHEED